MSFVRRRTVETAIGSFKALFREYVVVCTLKIAQWEAGIKIIADTSSTKPPFGKTGAGQRLKRQKEKERSI
ncbi:MAG: hypothetical protein QXS27_00420 [Candidatus Jordarchaeaceae archaeon]